MGFWLYDRLGNIEPIEAQPGETIVQVLLSNFIPPASVLVTCEGVSIADTQRVEAESNYEASLIEGYDIGAIRRVLSYLPDRREAVYLKRHLLFSSSGSLELEQQHLSNAELASLVERTVEETVSQFDLIQPSETITIGLSGGVDSSSLLMLLASLRQRRSSEFSLVAATFDDFDSKRSSTFEHARQLAAQLGVEHHIVPAALAQSTFHL